MDSRLRDYQQEMLGRLREAWKRHRGVMVQNLHAPSMPYSMDCTGYRRKRFFLQTPKKVRKL